MTKALAKTGRRPAAKVKKPAHNAHRPTDRTREQVRSMSGWGLAQDRICTIIGIKDPKTLRHHYAAEIAEGMAQADMGVGKSIYDQAVGRPAQIDPVTRLVIREELKPDRVAAIFLSKVRLGFRETQAIEHSFKLDLSCLTDEELTIYEGLLRKIAASRPA